MQTLRAILGLVALAVAGWSLTELQTTAPATPAPTPIAAAPSANPRLEAQLRATALAYRAAAFTLAGALAKDKKLTNQGLTAVEAAADLAGTVDSTREAAAADLAKRFREAEHHKTALVEALAATESFSTSWPVANDATRAPTSETPVFATPAQTPSANSHLTYALCSLGFCALLWIWAMLAAPKTQAHGAWTELERVPETHRAAVRSALSAVSAPDAKLTFAEHDTHVSAIVTSEDAHTRSVVNFPKTNRR